MYIDNSLQLSSAQAVTSSAASTNYVDLISAKRDIGVSNDIQVCVTVTTTCTASGSATVQFQLQNSASSGFGSVVNVTETDAIPKATLVAGYQFFMKVPVGTNLEFLQLYYNVGTGPLTAGAFTAQIVYGVQSNTAYDAPSQH